MNVNVDTPLSDFVDVIIRVFDFLILLASGVFVVFIIMGAIKMSLAQGDPKNLDAARWTMIYAFIGLIIVLLFFVVVRILFSFTGQDPFTDPNAPFESLREGLNSLDNIIRK